jgi:hypothetical protein
MDYQTYIQDEGAMMKNWVMPKDFHDTILPQYQEALISRRFEDLNIFLDEINWSLAKWLGYLSDKKYEVMGANNNVYIICKPQPLIPVV